MRRKVFFMRVNRLIPGRQGGESEDLCYRIVTKFRLNIPLKANMPFLMRKSFLRAVFFFLFLTNGLIAEDPKGGMDYKAGVELLKSAQDPLQQAAALEKFQSAAEAGYPDAFGAIGFFHANGAGGVPQNDAVALEWFQKGSDKGSVSAKVNLARFILEGRGATADRTKGIALMEEAASKGFEDAQVALAEIYFMGLYDPEAKPDFVKALPYVQVCSDRGSASALNMLGLIYKEGHGVPVDLKKAEELFRQSALKGDFKAQSNLGDLLDPYAKKKSRRIEATAWLIIASRQGEPLAVYRTGELQSQMESKDWEKATGLADELQAKIQP
jgi:TPR repeat protein